MGPIFLTCKPGKTGNSLASPDTEYSPEADAFFKMALNALIAFYVSHRNIFGAVLFDFLLWY